MKLSLLFVLALLAVARPATAQLPVPPISAAHPLLPVWTPEPDNRISEWLFQPGTKIDQPVDPTAWQPVNVPYLWTNGARHLIKTAGGKTPAWVDLDKALGNFDNGWFERTISVPSAWAGQRIWLKFDQVECDAMLWVDGGQPIYIEGPEARVDLTQLLKPGTQSTLRVWVTRWWEGIPKTMAQDPLRRDTLEAVAAASGGMDGLRKQLPGGISDFVHFEIRPLAAEIESVFARTSVREKTLFVDVEALASASPGQARLRLEVLDPHGQGKSVPTPVEVPLTIQGEGKQTVAIPWPNPRLWQLGDGYVYQLKATLLEASGRPLHEFPPVSFGFREISVQGRDIIINGFPAHLHLAPGFLIEYPSMLFWKGIGFNAWEWHPVPNSWYLQYGRRSLIIDSKDNPGLRAMRPDPLDKADEEGMGLLMPAPNISYIRYGIMNPVAALAYLRETDLWFKKLRNHPSILMWLPSMNTGSFTREKPELVGTNPVDPASVPVWYGVTDKLLASQDPTRIITHHCGVVGAIDYPNNYLNFMPLQERSEFPSHWAEKGERPWGAIEHGTPFSSNFSKWHDVPQYTEWHSIYFGDRAYARETDDYVKIIDDVTAHKATLTNDQLSKIGDLTAQFDFEAMFARETNRSWRAFGVPGGWKPWDYDSGFGVSPELQGKAHKNDFFYTELSEQEDRDSLVESPAWVNSVYKAYRETMQPLLAYLGGPAARFTAQDHAFFAGEEFEKTLVAVWDGHEKTKLEAKWSLEVDGQTLQSGSETVELTPGEIIKKPFALRAPAVRERTEGRISLSVKDAAGKEIRDAMDVSFWPRAEDRFQPHAKWAIYDPTGASAGWLKSLGVKAVSIQSREELQASGAEVLVLGRDAVGKVLPFTTAEVEQGLRVLILEQKPEALESLGVRTQDIVSRNVYPRDRQSPILAGLRDEDLTNWRGEATLLPPTSEGMKKWPLSRPPHWGNYGAVASVVIETPHSGAFTSLADAEFDLAYSPLLEWRDGKGGILFSQFDFTGRVGVDPAATHLAGNLIRAFDAPYRSPQSRTVRYLGDLAGWDYTQSLGFAASRLEAAGLAGLRPETDVLVVGAGGWAAVAAQAAAVQLFAAAGGRILVLPQKAADFAVAGAPFHPVTATVRSSRAQPGLAPSLRGIGPQALHWRAFLDQDRFTSQGVPAGASLLLDGLVLDVPQGSGRWVLSQLDWRALDDGGGWNLERARWNVTKYYRQLLTNLEARNTDAVAARLASPEFSAPLVNVPLWKIWNRTAQFDPTVANDIMPALASPLDLENGPASAQKNDQPKAEVATTVGEGEVKLIGLQSAAGGWRTYGPKSSNGFVYLEWVSPAQEGKVGYARSYVYSSRPRQAVFAVGADYRMIFRVNGETFVDHSQQPRAPHTPFAGEFRFTAPLKQGWNLLEVKVASGASGFGFWCSVSDPGDASFQATLEPPQQTPETKAVNLLPEPVFDARDVFYTRPLQPIDDPYRFNPW